MGSGSLSKHRLRAWINSVSSSDGRASRGSAERLAIRRELLGAATDRLSDETEACQAGLRASRYLRASSSVNLDTYL